VVELLFGLILAVIIYQMLKKVNESEKAAAAIEAQAKIIVTKKQCPPHQWFWQDMVDETGEVQGTRMVCKLCGPLSDVLDRNVK
jgi:hypothetical protein